MAGTDRRGRGRARATQAGLHPGGAAPGPT